MLRDYTDMVFGGVKLADEAIHTTADGRRLWVTHGDQFDAVVRYAKWLALLGDWAYTAAQNVNYWFNLCRRHLGFSYWSLSNYLKHKVKNAVQHIGKFEVAVADAARRREVDGVVCGHIHFAEIRDFDGVLYCNDGDWVESCTALVEHRNGQLEILDWAELRALSFMPPRKAAAADKPARLPVGAAARSRTES
jgi:UDP-2,3-diacylglucosamine pyrophosphatase LpxH